MLDLKTRELIAIAASVVAKCQPCLDYHVEEARKAGASDTDIRNAIKIARLVRQAGIEKMDAYADEKAGIEQEAKSEGCRSACSCSDIGEMEMG